MPKLKDIEQIRNVEWGKRFLWDISFEKVSSGGSLVSKALAKAGDVAKSKLDSYINDFTGKEQSLPTFGGMFEWFPITSVTDETVNATTNDFAGTYYNFPLIVGSTVLSISITFIDDAAGSMFNWCNEWLNPYKESIDTGLSRIVGNIPGASQYQTSAGTNIEGLVNIDGNTLSYKKKCIKTISEYSKVIVVSKLDNQLNDISTTKYVVIPTGTLTFRGTSDDSLPTYELKMLKVKDLGTTQGSTLPRFDIIGSKTAGLLRKVIS